MEKKDRKSIIIGITSLFLVMLLLVGLTYAYYRTRIIGNDSTDPSISVQSKKMEITYEDGAATMNMTGNIEPGFTASKTFYVENTGDEAVSFSILLDNVTNTFSRKSDWTYSLTKEGITNPIANGIVPSDTEYLVDSISVESKVKETYILTITYANLDDVNQSEDMGKTLSFRININDRVNNWDEPINGTLLYSLKKNNTVTTGLNGLSATEDDYGTSYYFKGLVSNNFVNFSGMCWRVLRVQGNGGIKLVLADRDFECNDDSYSINNIDTAFIDDTGYAFPLISEYRATESMYFENSEAYDTLNAWLNGGEYISYELSNEREDSMTGEKPVKGNFMKRIDNSKLMNAEWCQDLSIYNVDEENQTIFSGSNRIENNTPTLKCESIGSGVHKFNNKIGLLTADEIAFISSNAYLSPFEEDGIRDHMNGSYLEDNVGSETSYWTLTPILDSIYEESDEQGNLTGNLLNSPSYYFVYHGYLDWDWAEMIRYPEGLTDYITSFSLRPSIVLLPNVTATGTGTVNDPYIID